MTKKQVVSAIEEQVEYYESMVKACEKTENLVPLSFRTVAEMQTETYKTVLEDMKKLFERAAAE